MPLPPKRTVILAMRSTSPPIPTRSPRTWYCAASIRRRICARCRSRDGRTLRLDDLLTAFEAPDVQLAVLPAVVFTSGQLLDVATLHAQGRERRHRDRLGSFATVSARLPHALDRDGADFAFWCHYKWLNARSRRRRRTVFESSKLRSRARTRRLVGRARRAALRDGAAARAGRRRRGAAHRHAAPALARATARSLELIAEAGGVAALREKSLALTELLAARIDAELAPLGFRDRYGAARRLARGGHLALAHPEAWRLCAALKAAGVVADFRAPDLIRSRRRAVFEFSADCAEAIARLKRIAINGSMKNFPRNTRS